MKRRKITLHKMSELNEKDVQVSGSSSTSIDSTTMDELYHFRVAKDYMREHGKTPPRPPHLRGKAIGMWYCRMKKMRNTLEEQGHKDKFIRPVGNIKLTNSQKSGIKEVLDNIPDRMEQSIPETHKSYSNIKDSKFKRDFLQNINGKLEDHIANADFRLKQDSHIDDLLYNDLQAKYDNQTYAQMLKRKNNLPSFRVKERILELVNSYQVTLISGETGCGKTTQVPQFLLDHFIETKKGSMCKIVCTQPRRISAISVAERVAFERAEKLGESTGYQIRLEKVCPRSRGSVTFCTTGVVLRQMENDPCLREYTHIILDEIHERDIQTDFLITLLKQVINKRKDLRIILMSATLNAESFSKYFNKCPHLNIPGFTYHVEEYFLEDVLFRTRFQFDNTARFKHKPLTEKQIQFNAVIEPYIKKLQHENKYNMEVYKELRNPNSEILNLRLIFELLVDICNKEKDPGAVLIFVPGFAEISELNKTIETSGQFPRNRYIVIPLHSQIPTLQQKQVFDTPSRGIRKIVIATNIAETSITIDDVVYVIDCGRIKIKYYDPNTNTETLEAKWVSKANASQRKGRAGRVKPGVCFHLLSRARYKTLDAYILPEILRVRLENVILTAKILQLGKVESFFSKLMNSPDAGVTATSLELLKRLEALDESESLTPLGYHLAKLPMNPQVGKMLLFGALFNCLDPILNIAVTLDYKDPFLIPMGKEREADRKRKEFAGKCQSDHIFMNNLLRTFERLRESEQRKFCWDYFLSFQTMRQLVQLKKDFMVNLLELKFVPDKNPTNDECNSNSGNIDLVRAVLCAGLYPNVAKIRTKGRRKLFNLLYLLSGKRANFHPKSILNGEHITHNMLVYYNIVKSTKIFIHEATPVDQFHVIFFGDRFQHIKESGQHFITINDSLKFRCEQSTADVIKALRSKLNNFLEYLISHPNVVDLREDNEETVLFRTIIELLTSTQSIECELDSFDNEDID